MRHLNSPSTHDGTLILLDIESINLSLAGIRTFAKVSGLNLNLHKCEVIWLGQNPNYIPEYKGIHFTTKPVRCLGIYMGRNKKECERLNWENKLTFFENLLDRWKERHLIIFGKVVVVKLLAISQHVLNFSLLNVPKDIIKRINRLIYNFIWKSKVRIKRNVLIDNQEKEGINMVDVESKIKALKAAWVSRISDSSNSKMNAKFRIYLKEIGINLQQVLLMNFQHE